MNRSLACHWVFVLALAGTVSAADPFAVTTPGKPGGAGLVPQLSGFGTGLVDSGAVLRLGQAAASSSTTVVAGLSELAVPFKGGVLGPAVDFLVPALPIDAEGALALHFSVPAGTPTGLTLWTQCWVVDPAASGGLSASNTLTFTVQSAPAPLYDAGAALVAATPVGGPSSLAVGDFDEDGVPDVAVLVVGADAVQILRGLGDGTLAATPIGSVPAAGTAFTVADLDLDGHLDIATTGSLGDVVEVWFGDGDGTFGALDTYATGHLSVDIIAAAVDGDGKPDLVTADAPGTASVHLNRGGGTFYPAVAHTVGFNPTHVAVGDLDGDGEQDLAVSFGSSSGRVALLFGEGEATFSDPEPLFVGALPEDLVIDDFDGNGAPDIAVCHGASDDVVVLLGQGGGAFDAATSYPLPPGTQPETMACADLDADGALDLVVSRFDGLSVLRGTGNGAFFPEQAHALTGILKYGLAVADLDGDGALDLVTTRLTDDEIVALLQL